MATKMRNVVESGFHVTVAAARSFRLADMEPYRKLSGLCLKEMDIGWWDNRGGRVVLLELKGSTIWGGFDSSKDEAHDHLVANLRAKATDVLMLLAAVWIGTTCGRELKLLLPKGVESYPGDGKIKLVFLVDTPPSRKPLLIAIKDELNRQTGGRSRLFGVQHLTVVDLDVAVKMGLPVTRAT